MRKITEQSTAAFLSGVNYSSGNMTVISLDDEFETVEMRLHGNLIARAYDCPPEGDKGWRREVEISDAGWNTNTTKDRLNGILKYLAPGCGIYQKNHEWFIDVCDVRGDLDWLGKAIFSSDGHYLGRGY